MSKTLEQWLRSLPPEKRKKETKIAKRNQQRIAEFLNKRAKQGESK